MNTLSEEAKEFLRQRNFAVLATINKDGTPQQTVMWYALQDDRIMMNTAAGRIKEKNLVRDPRISLCVENEYEYITIKGHARLDHDRERTQADIYALALRYEDEETAQRMARNTFGKQDRITFYILLDEIDSVVMGMSGVRKEVSNKSS